MKRKRIVEVWDICVAIALKLLLGFVMVVSCLFMPFLCYAVGAMHHWTLGVLLVVLASCFSLIEFLRWMDAE